MVEHLKTLAIKGAITVDKNTEESIKEATIELLSQMQFSNNISTENITYAIFTLTKDINAAFPAKFARLDLKWEDIPMICTQELAVPDTLENCLRVIITINTTLKKSDIKHVYLKGAKKLRPDLT